MTHAEYVKWQREQREIDSKKPREKIKLKSYKEVLEEEYGRI